MISWGWYTKFEGKVKAFRVNKKTSLKSGEYFLLKSYETADCATVLEKDKKGGG